MKALPMTLVIATSGRVQALRRMLESVRMQSVWPAEMLIVDSSEVSETERLTSELGANFAPSTIVRWLEADARGAAAQRNQGVAKASQPVIGFADDDVILEQDCMERLWGALQSSPEVGGASAMITNQNYHEPGAPSRFIYRLIGGGPGPDYAGRIFGPAVHLLPADREGMPEVVPVEWLNTTLVLYRREALPQPPFASFFTGYSMMEDAALSLLVARNWRLVNARTARILHDTQPGAHKSNSCEVARMSVLNRDFVARNILGKKGIPYWSSLTLWAGFQLTSAILGVLRNPDAWLVIKGSLQGYIKVARRSSLPNDC